jgi:hypothetical protein
MLIFKQFKNSTILMYSRTVNYRILNLFTLTATSFFCLISQRHPRGHVYVLHSKLSNILLTAPCLGQRLNAACSLRVRRDGSERRCCRGAAAESELSAQKRSNDRGAKTAEVLGAEDSTERDLRVWEESGSSPSEVHSDLWQLMDSVVATKMTTLVANVKEPLMLTMIQLAILHAVGIDAATTAPRPKPPIFHLHQHGQPARQGRAKPTPLGYPAG